MKVFLAFVAVFISLLLILIVTVHRKANFIVNVYGTIIIMILILRNLNSLSLFDILFRISMGKVFHQDEQY